MNAIILFITSIFNFAFEIVNQYVDKILMPPQLAWAAKGSIDIDEIVKISEVVMHDTGNDG